MSIQVWYVQIEIYLKNIQVKKQSYHMYFIYIFEGI